MIKEIENFLGLADKYMELQQETRVAKDRLNIAMKQDTEQLMKARLISLKINWRRVWDLIRDPSRKG